MSKDHHAEAGYSLKNAFEAQASSAVLDLTGDDENQMRKKKQTMRWDAKKKKYVRAEQVRQTAAIRKIATDVTFL